MNTHQTFPRQPPDPDNPERIDLDLFLLLLLVLRVLPQDVGQLRDRGEAALGLVVFLSNA